MTIFLPFSRNHLLFRGKIREERELIKNSVVLEPRVRCLKLVSDWCIYRILSFGFPIFASWIHHSLLWSLQTWAYRTYSTQDTLFKIIFAVFWYVADTFSLGYLLLYFNDISQNLVLSISYTICRHEENAVSKSKVSASCCQLSLLSLNGTFLLELVKCWWRHP